MQAYCIFCKSGLETTIAKNINKVIKNIEAIVPTKVIKEKRNGKWEDKKQVLFPGYIFLYGEDEMDYSIRDRAFNVYKILRYENGAFELMGEDYQYAMWVYRHKGIIDTSRVLTEGKNVKVIEGPLLDFSGKITKLDKHKKKVWVEIDFYGEKKIISLSVECISVSDCN